MGNIKARGKAYPGQYRYFGQILNPKAQRELSQLANAKVRPDSMFRHIPARAGNELHKRFERMLVKAVNRATLVGSVTCTLARSRSAGTNRNISRNSMTCFRPPVS